MKLKTILLTSAAVIFASSALAAEDFTGTFFTPSKGGVLSDTTISSFRGKGNDGVNEPVAKALSVSEEVTYGVTDDFAVFGNIGNAFDVDGEFNNDHNFAYGIGAKYNYTHDKFLGQVAFSYNTADPRSWYGKSGEGNEYDTNRWAKALSGAIKLGYVLDCGLTPYTTFTMDGTIDRADRSQDYSWFLGAHKMLEKVSVDGGIRYDFGNGGDPFDAGADHYEAWFAQAEANYFVKENVTVGIFGDYYLGGTYRKDIDYGYTVGLNAKVLF